jgi:hypothetical protein
MTDQDKKIIANEDASIPSDEDIMAAYAQAIKDEEAASNIH